MTLQFLSKWSLRQILYVVGAWFPEDKPQCLSAYPVLAGIILADVPLAKAIHGGQDNAFSPKMLMYNSPKLMTILTYMVKGTLQILLS